ncbi:MAG: hypothetical protein KIT79_09640 [Deltaproteobacteria bacterium]|nr:hypothetical protein [Deltaproteobacteria bacterium]
MAGKLVTLVVTFDLDEDDDYDDAYKVLANFNLEPVTTKKIAIAEHYSDGEGNY